MSVQGSDIFVVANGDLRHQANRNCWPVQQKYTELLRQALRKHGRNLRPAHPYKEEQRHGFIASQREGCDVFAQLDPAAPVVVLVTAWQYSHHIAPSLLHHRGPVLLLANFEGTWPGLVGMLNLAGSLTGLGRSYARLWSPGFDDDMFFQGLEQWLRTGDIRHDVAHLRPFRSNESFRPGPESELGQQVAADILKRKELMGLFDVFCMGMLNGVFPQKLLADIGMPMEGLSQSALLHEMSLVGEELREQCLRYYEDAGMTFHYGEDEREHLTREQVKQQCAMLIATARMVERFGLTAVGIQYQQGLKDCCPASDFAEGALGSSTRFPIPDHDGHIIRPGCPIPHINEVDMGSGIPQIMLFKLLRKLGLPSETTLHDVRWGSEYKGKFYWDFEISGGVPFEHLHGGITAAQGYRQPPMYFPLGGSTIGGQCKAGTFVWARAHYCQQKVVLHLGSGQAVLLPPDEFNRRLQATTPQWPLMNAQLHGVSRDQLMAAHQSNHLTVAYVDRDRLAEVVAAMASMGHALGMEVQLAGDPVLPGRTDALAAESAGVL